MAVDENIEYMNLEEVVWALCTRVDPDIDILKRTQGSKVDPLRREPGPTFNSRALIDACKPFESIDEFPKSPNPARSTSKRSARSGGICFDFSVGFFSRADRARI